MSVDVEIRPVASDTVAGDGFAHYSCSRCDLADIAAGRPETAFCGFDVSGRKAIEPDSDGSSLMCAVCDDFVYCPRCKGRF